MAALFASLLGATPRLLGVDTPVDQIAEAARALRADVVGISVSGSSDPNQVAEQLRWLLSHLPASTDVWLGGQNARSVQIDSPRVAQVITWPQLEQEITRRMH